MAQKYKPQHRRLIFIDQQIGSGSYPNCSKLSRSWEVSAKTIQRDIDYLRDELGAPLEYSALHRGYFYRERTWQLPAIQVSEGDLFFMSVAEKILEQYENTPLHRTLCAVFDKIRQALPDKISIPAQLLSPRISIRGVPASLIDAQVWLTVAAAVQRDLRLEIEFRATGYRSFVCRVVEPYHLLGHSGEWYLIADGDRTGPLMYAMSRIRSARLLNEHFRSPSTFDVRKYLQGAFGVFRGDRSVTVRLRFCAEQAPYILERTWMEGQQVTRLKGGDIILSFKTTHLYEVTRWVLSWGEKVRVLAPQRLVEAVAGTLRRASVSYRH